ncbi:pantoate-beta-alanine ligase [Spiromyces aspiralis]|uniref:Pantoate-beta-alanine ligase n=1 Tax=Spiromyces aspiralis TaxID=68401 RepID=A0ACC1HE07_9FUNG|nr:pantoate-beta-alanine ligase [Spiromyces aspiralis]
MAASEQTEVVIVSIFVNPAQFAPHEDYNRYPRNIGQDVAALKALPPRDDGRPRVNAVFAPESVGEMYPRGISLHVPEQVGTFVEVLGLSSQLEGIARPHFFRGVATVVTKLFSAIQPEMAFFGQKDIQQCCIIRALVEDLLMPIKVVIVPTQRDSRTGLALSSRNAYLSEDERAKWAPIFYQGLSGAVQAYESEGERRAAVLLALVRDTIKNTEGSERLDIEYISLVDPATLKEITDSIEDATGAVLCGAWKMGSTRLIDNVLLGVPFVPEDK